MLRWLAYRDRRLDQGIGRFQIWQELAGEFSLAAIRLYLSPTARATHREAIRRYAADRRNRGIKDTVYHRNYRRLTKPIPQRRLLDSLYGHNDNDVLALQEIVESLPSLVENIRFRPATIETRFLRAYERGQREGRICGPPCLCEVMPRLWRYSDEPLPIDSPRPRS